MLNQFLVNALVPEKRAGDGGVYQLSVDSVSPVRRLGLSRTGEPIEETICALAKWALMVDRDGNICTVPLRTGRVPSEEPEAVRYEMIVLKDLISEGWIPLTSCPHTADFSYYFGRRGPLIAGGVDCGGAANAVDVESCCEHLKSIILERRERSRERYDAGERELKQMNEDKAKEMLAVFADMMDMKIDRDGRATRNAGVRSGRARLRSDGEKDEP